MDRGVIRPAYQCKVAAVADASANPRSARHITQSPLGGFGKVIAGRARRAAQRIRSRIVIRNTGLALRAKNTDCGYTVGVVGERVCQLLTLPQGGVERQHSVFSAKDVVGLGKVTVQLGPASQVTKRGTVSNRQNERARRRSVSVSASHRNRDRRVSRHVRSRALEKGSAVERQPSRQARHSSRVVKNARRLDLVVNSHVLVERNVRLAESSRAIVGVVLSRDDRVLRVRGGRRTSVDSARVGHVPRCKGRVVHEHVRVVTAGAASLLISVDSFSSGCQQGIVERAVRRFDVTPLESGRGDQLTLLQGSKLHAVSVGLPKETVRPRRRSRAKVRINNPVSAVSGLPDRSTASQVDTHTVVSVTGLRVAAARKHRVARRRTRVVSSRDSVSRTVNKTTEEVVGVGSQISRSGIHSRHNRRLRVVAVVSDTEV